MIIQVEQGLELFASYVALGVELAAISAVAIGAGQAIIATVRQLLPKVKGYSAPRDIWVGFARWILLSLEFTLGADIIRTAIAPSWDDIGQLAAIASIRTALNFFLERDFKEASELGENSTSTEG